VVDLGRGAAVGLAVVFVVAGAVKLRHGEATAVALRGLGLPVPVVLAWIVPVAELGLAWGLVARPRLGGAAALLALAGFSAVLWRALGRGKAVTCGCFGGTGSAPISVADLVRNGLLAVLAVAATAAPVAGPPSLAAVVAVTAAAVAGAVVVALVRLRAAVGPLLALASLPAQPEAGA
jgi:hypothetical protein